SPGLGSAACLGLIGRRILGGRLSVLLPASAVVAAVGLLTALRVGSASPASRPARKSAASTLSATSVSPTATVADIGHGRERGAGVAVNARHQHRPLLIYGVAADGDDPMQRS